MKPRARLLLGYLLVFTLMIVLATFTYQGISPLTDTADWVSHTHEAISEARL